MDREVARVLKPSPNGIPRRGSAFILLVFFLTCVAIVFYHDERLPKVRYAEDTPVNEFSEERARHHLHEICSKGVRLVGNYANEIETPAYILSQLHSIGIKKHKDVKMEVDVQRPSGTYNLDFINGFVTEYHNVTNIIVRLSSFDESTKKDNKETALLISAHFDSTFGTVAASDNAVNVATLIEVISILTQSQPLKHSVIFNLNGAEESILQGAHGFITSHPWAKSVKAFINLEGAGGYGRELVFQTGPQNAWLAMSYSQHAPYPYGNIAAQEVFQSGFIPSDTDFRVYRDFGKIPGIDIAYVSNGFVYHTTRDDVSGVTPGSLQRCGENVLSIIRDLCSSELLADAKSHEHDQAVYFDILGRFSVAYSIQLCMILNVALLIITAFILLKYKWLFNRYIFYSLLVQVISSICGVFVPLLIGITLSAVGLAMRWFSHPLLVVGLYVCPSLWAIIFVHRKYHDMALKQLSKSKISIKDHSDLIRVSLEHSFFISGLLIWLFILFVCTFFGLGSSYLPFLWVLGALLSRTLTFYNSTIPLNHEQIHKSLRNDSKKTHDFPLIKYFGLFSMCLFLGTTLTMAISVDFVQFFLPLMGRTGDMIDSDILIGGGIGFIIVLFSWQLIGMIHLDAKLDTCLHVLKFLFSLSLIIALFINPYSEANSKRLLTQHIEREWVSEKGNIKYNRDANTNYDSNYKMNKTIDEWKMLKHFNKPLILDFQRYSHDSGLVLLPLDGLGMKPFKGYHPSMKNLESLKLTGNEVYQDLPFIFPVIDFIGGNTHYMPLDSPPVFPLSLSIRMTKEAKLINNKKKSNKILRLDVEVEGSHHIGLIIDAKRETFSNRLTNWSFNVPTEPQGLNKDVHFVYFVAGNEHEDGTVPTYWSDEAFKDTILVSSYPLIRLKHSNDNNQENKGENRNGNNYDYERHYNLESEKSKVWSRHHKWKFWLEFEIIDDTEDIKFTLSTHHFDQKPLSSVTEIIDTLPKWIDHIGWISEWKSFSVSPIDTL